MKWQEITGIVIILLFINTGFAQTRFFDLPVGTKLIIKKDVFIKAYETNVGLNTYRFPKYKCFTSLILKVKKSNQNRIISKGYEFKIKNRSSLGMILDNGEILSIYQDNCLARGFHIPYDEISSPLFDIFDIEAPSVVPY